MALTNNQTVLDWIDEMAAMTQKNAETAQQASTYAGDAKKAAEAEKALHGHATPGLDLRHGDVAPLWLWLTLPSTNTASATPTQKKQGQGAEEGAVQPPAVSDPRRRAAQSVADERNNAPLMMMFRAESILSWTEFTRVNRADDDEAGERG